jgi:hypothetical protein
MGGVVKDIRRQMAAAHNAWQRGSVSGGDDALARARARAGPKPWLDDLLARVAAGGQLAAEAQSIGVGGTAGAIGSLGPHGRRGRRLAAGYALPPGRRSRARGIFPAAC